LRQAYVAPKSQTPSAPASLALDDFSDLLGPGPTTAIVSAPPAILARVEVGLAAAHMPVARPSAAPEVAERPVPPPMESASSEPTGHYSDTELLAAFLRGVDSTHQMPVALTPGLMERIGSMLRTATEGTLQLLLTRQEFKREVRAAVTVIGAQHNNPLKFSPTVEVALAHLLGPGVRGFMPAQEAMRDAFHDLRSHQFGVMVGMHAALEHVLSRFTPDVLESRLTEKSTFDALFSSGRKAKLWDQFCTLYASISQDAKEDFHKLFGEAFSKAYDEQMSRFKSEAGKP
jgi:FHA domain-containing protein